MLNLGWLLALIGKAAEAVPLISGDSRISRNRIDELDAATASYLAMAHAEIGQFDEAWRCIGEA